MVFDNVIKYTRKIELKMLASHSMKRMEGVEGR